MKKVLNLLNGLCGLGENGADVNGKKIALEVAIEEYQAHLF